MNKKGFTLVELLAVIAILAILVIIALPNVLDLFNNAKANSFQTEVQTIFNTAQQEFILGGGKAVEFYRNNKEGCAANTAIKSLSLKGNSAINYYIKIDGSGKVVNYYVTNGEYAFSFTKTTDHPELKIDEIGTATYAKVIANADDATNYTSAQNSLAAGCKAEAN